MQLYRLVVCFVVGICVRGIGTVSGMEPLYIHPKTLPETEIHAYDQECIKCMALSAARNGEFLRVVRYLCDVKFDKCVNPQQKLAAIRDEVGNSIVHLAVIHEWPELLGMLTRVAYWDGDDTRKLDLNGCADLYKAVITGDVAAVDKLLGRHKVDPNGLVNGEGRTPASCRGIIQEKFPQWCQKFGLQEETPLGLAVQNGNGVIVHLLTQHGARVKVFNSRGATPLHYAAAQEHASNLLDVLLGCDDADVNVPDHKHMTPLHWAAWHGRINSVAKLLDYEADVTCQDVSGCTALDYARQREHLLIVALLEKHQHISQSTSATHSSAGAFQEPPAQQKGASLAPLEQLPKKIVEMRRDGNSDVENVRDRLAAMQVHTHVVKKVPDTQRRKPIVRTSGSQTAAATRLASGKSATASLSPVALCESWGKARTPPQWR